MPRRQAGKVSQSRLNKHDMPSIPPCSGWRQITLAGGVMPIRRRPDAVWTGMLSTSRPPHLTELRKVGFSFPSTASGLAVDSRTRVPFGGFPMLALVRAGLAAALVVLASLPAATTDKAFQRDDLADAAVRLEGQVKSEARQAGKPAATLRREADVAL